MTLAELATTLILTTAPSSVANFDKEEIKLEIESTAIGTIQRSLQLEFNALEIKVASKSNDEPVRVSEAD